MYGRFPYDLAGDTIEKSGGCENVHHFFAGVGTMVGISAKCFHGRCRFVKTFV